MDIPVNFSHDVRFGQTRASVLPATDGVAFVDPEVVNFLRSSGAIRGRNLSTRAILPIYRAACHIADSPMPCVAAWQQAMQDSPAMPVGVPGYGRRS